MQVQGLMPVLGALGGRELIEFRNSRRWCDERQVERYREPKHEVDRPTTDVHVIEVVDIIDNNN